MPAGTMCRWDMTLTTHVHLLLIYVWSHYLLSLNVFVLWMGTASPLWTVVVNNLSPVKKKITTEYESCNDLLGSIQHVSMCVACKNHKLVSNLIIICVYLRDCITEIFH
jgi:hypothetical protein